MSDPTATSGTTRSELVVACPIHKTPSWGYGASNNFKNDSGGWLTAGVSLPGNQRAAAVSAQRGNCQTPSDLSSSPSGGSPPTQGNQVIQPSRRVLSVPRNTGSATPDTQNSTQTAPAYYDARPLRHATPTAVAA